MLSNPRVLPWLDRGILTKNQLLCVIDTWWSIEEKPFPRRQNAGEELGILKNEKVEYNFCKSKSWWFHDQDKKEKAKTQLKRWATVSLSWENTIFVSEINRRYLNVWKPSGNVDYSSRRNQVNNESIRRYSGIKCMQLLKVIIQERSFFRCIYFKPGYMVLLLCFVIGLSFSRHILSQSEREKLSLIRMHFPAFPAGCTFACFPDLLGPQNNIPGILKRPNRHTRGMWKLTFGELTFHQSLSWRANDRNTGLYPLSMVTWRYQLVCYQIFAFHFLTDSATQFFWKLNLQPKQIEYFSKGLLARISAWGSMTFRRAIFHALPRSSLNW